MHQFLFLRSKQKSDYLLSNQTVDNASAIIDIEIQRTIIRTGVAHLKNE